MRTGIALASWRLGVGTLGVLVALGVTTATQAPRAFDVVSIKPNVTGQIGFSVKAFRGGQASMTNATLRMLLYRAFDITADTPVVGLPKWADSDHYDVVVKSDAMPAAAEQREMWHTLLVERLQLAAHEETREQPIYNLVLARPDKGPGPGLTPSTLKCPVSVPPPDVTAFQRQRVPAGLPPSPNAPARSAVLSPDFIAERLKSCGMYAGDATILSGAMTMAGLANFLTERAERPVVDKTGLTGAYTVRMVSAPDDNASPFTLVQEQLGLKLEAARAPGRTLVIDRIERPTEN